MWRNRSRIAVKSLLGQSTRNVWKTEGQGGIPQHPCRGATHPSAMSTSPFYRAILPVPDSAFTHTHTHTRGFHKYVHTHAYEYMNTHTPCSCVCVCIHQYLSNTIKAVLEKGNLKGMHFQSHKCPYSDLLIPWEFITRK